MTTQQWQLVKELFEAALERGDEDRAAFLVEACPEDSEVRAEVESLLDAHARDSGFMNQPAGNLLVDRNPILLTGQHLGNYEVISTLGKGGMGQVYLALDTRLGRKVALKLLPFSQTLEPNHVQRLEQEARTASALNHPNIVTIHEIGEADSIHFMATEYVDGETLRQRMLNTELSVREIVGIAVQIASALRAAHQAGIVHRDIKPENIMLRSDGVVKVLDFGLAKLTGSANSETESPGLIMGTTAYMSPEQARGEMVDARTDVWSLAVVIYEMIKGRVPFTGETHRQVVTEILQNDPPTLDSDSTVPDELKHIVAKALNKDRTKRYDDASTMADDLKSLQAELEVRARLELANASQDEAGARRISLATSPHLPTRTAGFRHERRNIQDYLRRHKVLTGIAVILVAGAVGWAYVTAHRNKANPGAISRRSIAVLPLKPINSATRDVVYETGIAESLIGKLGEMDGVVVRQLSATRHYTDLAQDPISAGKEQQVDYVVASKYYLENSKIHITAELINVQTGRTEERFEVEEQTSDAFAMQDAVAGNLGNKLLRQFATTASRQTAKHGTANREAYRLYLHGMYLANKRNLADAQKAVEALQQAVQLDPKYAQAWAGLAYVHRTISLYSSVSTHETYQKSIDAINKALAIDEGLSEAHSALCENKYLYEWDFAGAELECKRAIELDPNSAQAHEIYSRYLMGRGRLNEAISEIETAIDLDPASRFNHRNYARALLYARRYKEAEEEFKRVLAMDQSFVSTYSWLTSTLALQGKEAEAYDWFKKLLAYRKTDQETVDVFEKAFRTSGWHGVWREWLKRIDTVGGNTFDGALYNAQLGNKDEAFKYLEAIYQQRGIWMTYLRVEPRLDPLRDDPRFHDLLRRVEGR